MYRRDVFRWMGDISVSNRPFTGEMEWLDKMSTRGVVSEGDHKNTRLNIW